MAKQAPFAYVFHTKEESPNLSFMSQKLSNVAKFLHMAQKKIAKSESEIHFLRNLVEMAEILRLCDVIMP